MSDLPQKLTRIFEQQRRIIPTANIPAYNAIWDDYRPRILAEPENYATLTAELWNRIQALTDARLSSLPPALKRQPEETPNQYLDRCYTGRKSP